MNNIQSLIHLSIFASGGGGNFKYIIENKNINNIKINSLIVDRDCDAIKLAKANKIPVIAIKEYGYDNLFNFNQFTDSDILILAGFMPIVPSDFIHKLSEQKKYLINTHPSLLPKHGGKGMYGVHVQEAVLKNKDKIAGCTAHFVNEEVDGGKIICQSSINIPDGISAWDLGGRVFDLEGPNLINAINIVRKI